MKKIISTVLIVMLSLSLFACGKANNGPKPGTPLNTFYEAIFRLCRQDGFIKCI